MGRGSLSEIIIGVFLPRENISSKLLLKKRYLGLAFWKGPRKVKEWLLIHLFSGDLWKKGVKTFFKRSI